MASPGDGVDNDCDGETDEEVCTDLDMGKDILVEYWVNSGILLLA